MPQLDKSGPNGDGPQTGRGAGNCPSEKQSEEPTKFVRGPGRGFGRGSGRGAGRGFGRRGR